VAVEDLAEVAVTAVIAMPGRLLRVPRSSRLGNDAATKPVRCRPSAVVSGIRNGPAAIPPIGLMAGKASVRSAGAVVAPAASSAPRADASFNVGSHPPFAAYGFLLFARAYAQVRANP
jgi:hypothetical protein